MATRHRLAAALAVAALSVGAPADALAQNAGDDQYSDPFGTSTPQNSGSGSQGGGSSQSGSRGGGSQSGSQAQPAQGSTPAAPTAPQGAGSASTPAQPAAAGELPRTGTPAWPLAATGVLCLGASAALRRTVR